MKLSAASKFSFDFIALGFLAVFCCLAVCCCSRSVLADWGPSLACLFAKPRYENDTLRINLGAEPPGLDWHTATDSTSFDVVSNLMVGLTQYRNDLTCAPSIASSWQVLDGGRRYLFHLRDDALWSDGKKVTAYDFEYSWKRILSPKTASQYGYFLYDIENAFAFNTGKLTDFKRVGIKALDAATFEVKLKDPAAYFIYLTAFCPTFPMRQDIVERYNDRWTEPEHIVTNGPFLLSHWQHEYKIELIANPRYCGGVPRVKKIKMFMVPEQSTAFALYENDELDYVDNRSFSTPDVERYKNSKEYRNIPLLRCYYVGFNVEKPPFNDKRLRRAFGMALEREQLPKILRRGERPQPSWIPPGLTGYARDSGLPFNPQKARQLLREAGYPDGKGFPRVELLYPSREDARLVVEALQDQIKRNLGIHLEIINKELKVYFADLRQDPPPIFRGSWGADYPDPQTFMNVFTSHSGNNDARFHNAQYDRLVDEASGEQNPLLRAKLYEQADKLLCRDEAAIVPNYLATQNLMVKPWVHGIALNRLDLQFFNDVYIDPLPQ